MIAGFRRADEGRDDVAHSGRAAMMACRDNRVVRAQDADSTDVERA
jgi:hypothetical protein